MVVFPMSLVFVPAEISPDLEPVNINWSEKISLLIFKLRHATVLNIMVCSTVIMVKNSAVLTYMSISDSELAKGQKKNTKMHYGTPQRQLTELSELNFNKQTDHDWKKKKKSMKKLREKNVSDLKPPKVNCSAYQGWLMHLPRSFFSSLCLTFVDVGKHIVIGAETLHNNMFLTWKRSWAYLLPAIYNSLWKQNPKLCKFKCFM